MDPQHPSQPSLENLGQVVDQVIEKKDKIAAKKEASLVPIGGKEDVATKVEEDDDDEEGGIGEPEKNVDDEKEASKGSYYSTDQSENEEEAMEDDAPILAILSHNSPHLLKF